MNRELKYKNIILKPYNETHFKNTLQWFQDPIIKKNFGLNDEITLDKHREWFYKNKDVEILAIYDSELNLYVGNVLLFVNQRHKSSFFQIYIGESKGKGKKIGKHALERALIYVFDELNYNRMWLKVFEFNKVAINLYTELGFQLEGIERESFFDGKEFHNQLVYSILKKEWRDKN